ncbi:hypothetical protein BW898_20400 [Bacillus cereus]|nr:hypothetical protein BW898_20400 [Bacillus cereus]
MQQVAIRLVYQQLVAITMNARFHKIITCFFHFYFLIYFMMKTNPKLQFVEGFNNYRFGQARFINNNFPR